MGLVVCFSPEMTIVSKLRFEFDESNGNNVIDNEVIGRLAFVHQEAVAGTTGNNTAGDLTCFVMTHSQSEINGVYVEDVYFQFPFLKSSSQYMAERLVANLKHYFTQTGIHCDSLSIVHPTLSTRSFLETFTKSVTGLCLDLTSTTVCFKSLMFSIESPWSKLRTAR